MISRLFYRTKWHLAPYLKFNSPVHIDLELTTNCNQKCIFCWHSQGFKTRVMGYDDAIFFLEESRRMGAVSVKLNWRGEPLLYPRIVDVVRRAKELGYIDIMINTNGVFLRNKFIDLQKAGLTKCIISVDSFKHETYCKLHGVQERDFAILINTLLWLKLMKVDGKLKTEIVLNYHVNEYNRHEGFEYYEKYFRDFKIVKRYTEAREGRDISIKRERSRKKSCPHMSRRLTISADCKIYPCCVAYNDPKDLYVGATPQKAWSRSQEKRMDYNSGNIPYSCLICTSGDIYK